MINLHILNAHGKLTPYAKPITEAFDGAVEKILKLLPVSHVDVVVYLDADSVIPSLGLSGYAPSEDRVLIAVDIANENFLSSLETKFHTNLGHELHHCMRWRTVGYGTTLFEALISEGLACHFETELQPDYVPFYARALGAPQIPELLSQASQFFDDDNYDHAMWFFGQGGAVPFSTGYTLGFELVRAFLLEHKTVASKLHDIPAARFREFVEVVVNP